MIRHTAVRDIHTDSDPYKRGEVDDNLMIWNCAAFPSDYEWSFKGMELLLFLVNSTLNSPNDDRGGGCCTSCNINRYL